jgi:integration host factor subunit beta
MNKSQIVDLIAAKKSYLSRKDIEDSLSEILSCISNALSDTNRVEVRGFGTFTSRKRESRVARNPKTGTAVRVEAKYHPYFRASKHLKASLKD